MNAFKQRCIDLRKQDYTLPEIVKITGRSKTSVHFHIQNLPLSLGKQKNILESSRLRARALAQERKGKSAKSFMSFSAWDPETVSTVSHLLFDGEINLRGCVYNNRNIALIKHFKRCMNKIYEYEPKRYRDARTGVSRVSYFNVALAAYLKEKSRQLLEDIPHLQKRLKRECVRAFFDDEGCMDFRPKRNLRQIRGYQKDVSILDLIQKLLCDFGIESSVKKPNEIVIKGKNNLLKFRRVINFSPGVRINGNRPNSIWRKSLEKRELLDRAITSFKI